MNTRMRCCALFASFALVGMLFLDRAPAGAQTFFVETTGPALNNRVVAAASLAFGDYNNDGWPDLFVANDAPVGGISLQHNEGDGTFRGRSRRIRAILPPAVKGGMSMGDYDNDGDLDLHLALSLDFAERSPRIANVLLRNDRGYFVDATIAAGLDEALPTHGALWLDYDRDGDLDIYRANAGVGSGLVEPIIQNTLYRNEGDGTFVNATAAAGLDLILQPLSGGSSGGMAAADFDGDGWPDLYVGVSRGLNRLFLNNREGGFDEVLLGEFGDVSEALGAAAGDIDGDGDLDIFQGAAGSMLLPTFSSTLLENRGGGQFADITAAAGLGAVANIVIRGVGLVDIDNDGDLDLLTVGAPFLFANEGDGTFVEQSARSGIESRGTTFASADYDLDGFVDVAVGEPFSFGGGSSRLFRNRGNDNHWLRLELAGTQSNRSALGARLRTPFGARSIASSFGRDQVEVPAHLGLGARAQIDELEIRWPSGLSEVFGGLGAGQILRIIEGEGAAHPLRPALWEEVPDSVVAAARFTLRAVLRPNLLAPGARIVRIVADLSGLGGPAEVPLSDLGEGRYLLEAEFELRNGTRNLEVLVEQESAQRRYWSVLPRTLIAVPADDLSILDEGMPEEWRFEGGEGVGEPRFVEDPPPPQGAFALALRAGAGDWHATYSAPERFSATGYAALRFAFHPGTLRAGAGERLEVELLGEGSREVDLLSKKEEENRPEDEGQKKPPGLDLELKTWQSVEIPLDAFGRLTQIEGVRFSGTVAGTFFVDDLRLIAVPPPHPPMTAVLEEHTNPVPQAFLLEQNFPNPFNGETVIHFALPASAEVELNVYNLLGQKVVTLVRGRRPAGAHALRWDGRDERGRQLASGVYLYRLRAGAQTQTRKLLLLR